MAVLGETRRYAEIVGEQWRLPIPTARDELIVDL